jgi:TPR repeat protein
MGIEEIQTAANKGERNAQHQIGRAYLRGSDGLNQNFSKAFEWFQMSANQGHVEALLELGNAFYSGAGVDRNLNRAFEIYLQAAEHGNADAQNIVGAMYGKGVGVSQSYENAVKWLKLAGCQGHPVAQNSLGLCYLYGNGVNKDLFEALSWLNSSANGPCGGYIEAQFNLGQCYSGACLMAYPNEIVEKVIDSESAIKWFRTAAEKDHTDAQFELGKMLLSSGVFHRLEPKISEGLKWLKMTAEKGHIRSANIIRLHLANTRKF